jgi:hypothetical protein
MMICSANLIFNYSSSSGLRLTPAMKGFPSTKWLYEGKREELVASNE